jgi:EAL domain-containing protein (putative c-di-GMP-specific phosphodiesterase class I)
MAINMEQDLKQFFDDILFEGAIRTLFQPIVDLKSAEVAGYEALSRGPEGSRLERPDLLFDAARSYERVGDLDWVCRAGALRTALDAGMGDPLTLFINVEPETLTISLPESYKETWDEARSDLRVILEVNERSLTTSPANLFRRVHEMRELGWGIALDDVGSTQRSVAMLPFLRPDIIKLDLALLRERPRSELARIVHAVQGEAERRGAAILAEGIENDEDLEQALTMGATLGQGWLLGRPEQLPAPLPRPAASIPIAPLPEKSPSLLTPYQILSASKEVVQGTGRMLQQISRQLETHALTLRESPVILSTFQDQARFSGESKGLYVDLGKRAALVAAFGAGMPEEPGPGVRGTNIEPGDPLQDEWDVVAVGPHFAAAVAALDLGIVGPGGERRFNYAVTYDREIVLTLALSLLSRVLEAPL